VAPGGSHSDPKFCDYRGVAVRRGPSRWLIAAAAALVVVGVALAVWWPGSGSAESRTVSATVVSAASCQGANAYDTVELTIDGVKKRARLDGCGHREGDVLTVDVPQSAGGDLLVQPAGANPVGSGVTGRLSALLVSIAALAGAGYAHLLRRRPLT
jgi:hypothetical protein